MTGIEMAKISKAGLLSTLLALATVLMATDPVTYTIEGKKDPRLEAWYLATYVSQDPDEECTSKNAFTGGRRFALGSRSIKVEDENYTIEFPIKVTGENNDCDYRFRKLELVMKRKYDKELASIHPILSDEQKVSPIYWKTKGGAMSLKKPDTPPSLFTTKKYFRIADATTFLCKTKWYKSSQDSTFHCTMQIDSDMNRTLYRQKTPTMAVYTHPLFGVDELKDETMKIDILVDEKNCKANLGRDNVNAPDNFRELEEPNFWQKIF